MLNNYDLCGKNNVIFKEKRLLLLFLCVVVLFNAGFVQLRSENLSSLLFKPLEANVLESRVGALYEINDEKLRLDIGHSLDIYRFNSSDSNIQNSIGADFFILSRLRSVGRMKFPVETADYFFGVNWCSKFSLWDIKLSSRLRAAHISSHLIDGYTNDENEFIQEPFVYSREFLDLVLAYDDFKYIRPYIGATYIFSTLPKDIKTVFLQTGFDFDYNVYKKLYISGGYDFKLIGNQNNNNDIINVGCNALQMGIKCYMYNSTALSLMYYYYSGYSVHGMFYNQKDNYHGLGFQITY